MSDPSAAEMIDYLVSTRFPVDFGTFFTPAGLIIGSDKKKNADALRAELSGLDYESLKSRYETFVVELRKLMEAKEAAQPFNKPHARANFDHWAKMEYWKVDEGIALLLGRSPDVLVWESVKHIASPVVVQFRQIREAAERAVQWKRLHQGNRPAEFILWAKRLEYPVPQELEEKVAKYGHYMGDWYSNYTALKKLYDRQQEQHEEYTEKAKATYEGMIEDWKEQYRTLSERSAANHSKAMGIIQQRNDKIAELNQEIERLSSALTAAPKEKPLGQREGDTLRKLVIGMAIGG